MRLVDGRYVALLKNNDQTRLKNIETGEIFHKANISEYAHTRYGLDISWARSINEIQQECTSTRCRKNGDIERYYEQLEIEHMDDSHCRENRKKQAKEQKDKEHSLKLIDENYPLIFRGNIVTISEIYKVIEVCKRHDKQNGLTYEKYLRDKAKEEREKAQEQEAYDSLNF